MAIWTAEIREIEKLLESLGDKFPVLGKELGNLIKTEDENVALLYSRRCLEVIVTDLCESELKRSRGTEPLKGIIDKLQKEEKVPFHIIASMHGLNTMSTFGTHPRDFDPEQVKPVMNNLLIVIKWYLRYKDPVAFGKLVKGDEKNETGPAAVLKKGNGRPGKRVWQMISGFLILLVVVAVIITLGKFNIIRLGNQALESRSIAILPFKDLSNDPEQEYFSYSIVEEIQDRLFRIKKLRIISHSSSARLAKSNLSLKDMAVQLGASIFLDGSVQKTGDKIRVTIQLIDTQTGTQLWSNIFNNDFSDIFLIYSEVAKTVARELKVPVSAEEEKLIDRVPTTDITAYEAYMKGLMYWSKLSPKDTDIALRYFEVAKEKDPGFALAYAGISKVWGWRGLSGIAPTSEAIPKSEEALNRALALDSMQTEVIYRVAGFSVWTKWDWKKGEAYFRKTLEMNPNHAEAYAYYSHLLNILGRPEEAMKQIEKALKLDPFNPLIRALYGVDLLFLRKYDEAAMAFQEALELNPTQGVAYSNLASTLNYAGREDEAAELRRNRQKNDPEYLKAFDEGYAESGWEGANKKVADLYAKRSATQYVGPWTIAGHYAYGGDIDNAMYWLERAYGEHSYSMPYLLQPRWDKLRDDPRFQDLARRMNLPYK